MQIREIKKEAKERFALNRYHAMLVYGVVYTLALNICVLTTVLALLSMWAIWYGIILIFLFLLMLAPFGFGMTGFYIKLYKFEKTDAFHIFDGFNKYNLERVIVLRLLKFALWLAFTVLLVIPGIVFSVRTSMATYILRANPKMKPLDALKASNRIMKTHCFKYFGLVISFTCWMLMGLLTCGLGYIWVMPYLNTAKIVFYKRELQGDKTVYRNPMETENDGLNVLAGASKPVSESSSSDEIAFTIELPSMPEPPSPKSSDAERYVAESRVAEPRAMRSQNTEREISSRATARENPAFEQAAEGLRRMDKMPLPGGRVFYDGEGRRVVDRRRVEPEPEPADNSVEISESGESNGSESIREQIARRRAERTASVSGADVPRRRSTDRRRPSEIRENTEIGDN